MNATWRKLACACAFVLCGRTMAQGTTEYTILETGGGESLATESVPLVIDRAGPMLQFTFGFGTEEEAGEGEILDSFTFSLEGPGAATLLFLTADGSGVAWAPETPGTLPIAAESIVRSAAVWPGAIGPALPNAYSYEVLAMLPPEWEGQSAIFRADLFDNLGGGSSMGWFGGVTVVPEPAPWLMGGLFLLFYLCRKKK